MSYNECPEEYHGYDEGSGPDRTAQAYGEIRWLGARLDRSDFPDVDQMLCDIGPVIDESAGPEFDIAEFRSQMLRDIASALSIPRHLIYG